MPAVILTYHSMNVIGNDYADNDHVALARDLRLLDAEGFDIVSLDTLLDGWEARELHARRLVALTFDDGGALDARDVVHPACGAQTSFLNILRAFRDEAGGRQPGLHASAFVIASADARAELDRRDFLALGWWGDDWWQDATDSGLMAIENHSWDHHHPSLTSTATGQRGRFDGIDNAAQADLEIAQASDYIASRCGRRPIAFAYPWGQVAPFVCDVYLPDRAAELGLRAAFTTQPAPLPSDDASRWSLPRYVCGEHWRAPDELRRLLRAACAAPASDSAKLAR